MNMAEYKEFTLWTQEDNASVAQKKSEALEMFCDFHSMDPSQFIREVELAKNTEVEADGLWCSGHVASQRIQQFYSYLTKPQTMGGLGYDGPEADKLWPVVRSFYTRHGVVTDIESMASWEDCPQITYIRRIPFGKWDWRKN